MYDEYVFIPRGVVCFRDSKTSFKSEKKILYAKIPKKEFDNKAGLSSGEKAVAKEAVNNIYSKPFIEYMDKVLNNG